MTVVVKVGGSIASNGIPDRLIADIASLAESGLIVVHGGGPAVTELTSSLGIEPKFITSPNGIRSRYTDAATMSAFLMAIKGKINTEIVLALGRYGVNAVGLTGIDAGLIQAERKARLRTFSENGRPMLIDGGYTGRITGVNSSFLKILLGELLVPVIAPIAVSSQMEALNVDGDRAAAAVAGSIGSSLLVLLTNVDAVILDGKPVRTIKRDELMDVMKKVGSGMDKKLLAAGEAIDSGVSRVVICNGNSERPVSEAVDNSIGTVITK